MPLVLELPAETEAQFRAAAARVGRGVEDFIIEAARREALQIPLHSLDEAARRLNVARAFIEESVQKGDLKGETRDGELFVFADEKFEVLRQQQTQTQSALIEIARINSSLGLYEN